MVKGILLIGRDSFQGRATGRQCTRGGGELGRQKREHVQCMRIAYPLLALPTQGTMRDTIDFIRSIASCSSASMTIVMPSGMQHSLSIDPLHSPIYIYPRLSFHSQCHSSLSAWSVYFCIHSCLSAPSHSPCVPCHVASLLSVHPPSFHLFQSYTTLSLILFHGCHQLGRACNLDGSGGLYRTRLRQAALSGNIVSLRMPFFLALLLVPLPCLTSLLFRLILRE